MANVEELIRVEDRDEVVLAKCFSSGPQVKEIRLGVCQAALPLAVESKGPSDRRKAEAH